MVFQIPGDPFLEALGQSIGGAAKSVTGGVVKRREKEALKEAEKQQVQNYAQNLMQYLGIKLESPAGQTLSQFETLKPVMQYGDMLSRETIAREKAKVSPLQKRKEERLESKEIGTHYQRLVKDINDNVDLGNIDRKVGKKAIGDLRQEEHKNYKNIKEGKDLETKAIEQYFEQFIEKEEEQKPGIFERLGTFFSGGSTQEEPQVEEEVEEKIKFDPKNPEHVQVVEKAKVDAGGDEKKAREILDKIFKK